MKIQLEKIKEKAIRIYNKYSPLVPFGIKKRIKPVISKAYHTPRKIKISVSAFVLGIITFCAFFTPAYTVTIGGCNVAVAKSLEDVSDAVININSQYKDICDGKNALSSYPECSLTITLRKDVSDSESLPNEIKKGVSDLLGQFVIFVDSVPSVGFKTREAAEKALEMYAKKYVYDSDEYTFVNDVKIKFDYAPELVLAKNEEQALKKLEGNNSTIPLLKVQTTYQEVREETVMYDTEEYKDDTIPIGSKKITTYGKQGIYETVNEITEINGEIVSDHTVSYNVIEEPVTQVVLIGSKKRSAGVGTGRFMHPLKGSVLSSSFGERWGKQHEGVDFASPEGTPIKAADTGKVIVADEVPGYGLYIKIDHGNGYVTGYGHCSKLLVNKGDVVQKGDKIARVGNTGKSTGPHLHFEIWIDNVAHNPLNFLY